MPTKNKPMNYRYCMSLVVLGSVIIFLSTIILINKETFWMKLFDWIGWFFLIGAVRTWLSFYKHRETQLLIRGIINTLSGLFLIAFPQIPARLAFVCMALYITANGIVKFISFILLKAGTINRRLYFLVTAVFLIFIGLAILIGQVATIRWTMIFLGVYGLLLGITYIADGLASILPTKKKDAVKRSLRISPPIVVTAFMPRIMLDYINEKLSSDTTHVIHRTSDEFIPNVEILVHVTEKGFGAIGHCDLSIDGRVYSYANYDRSSIKLYEAIGDGVLAETDIQSYIPFCLKESQKTIFSYGLYLNQPQMQQVNIELAKVKQPAYTWYPNSWYNENDCDDYASKLFLASNRQATFSKFHHGQFKNYFVLGANCVELVEALLGRSGMDVIHFNGIVSPGAYQAYLEKEFHRTNGMVITRKVYRPNNPVSKFSLLDIIR